MDPIEPVDLQPFLRIVEQLNVAIELRNDREITQRSNDAIDCLLLDLLSTSAQAYARQGLYASAYSSIDRMINNLPKCAAGYILLVKALSMACRQHDVVLACNRALESADLTTEQESWILAASDTAIRLKRSREDPFIRLPFEITDDIFSRLKKSTFVSCLAVSRLWKERTTECASVWVNLCIKNGDTMLVVYGMKNFAQHVRYLTLETSNTKVRSLCLDHMIAGRFINLQQFTMTVYATQRLRDVLKPLSQALQQMRHTLTHLKIYQKNINVSVFLAQVLEHSYALKSLFYGTSQSLLRVFGDFTKLKRPHSLENLELRSLAVASEHVECILKTCQNLRRFVVGKCESPILDIVVTQALPTLEILAYNSDKCEVPKLNREKRLILREIYCSRPTDGIKSIMLFIHHYMSTLEVININTANLRTLTPEEHLQIPSVLHFKHLQLLGIGLDPLIQSMLLDGVREIKSLKHLNAYKVHDVTSLSDVLMDIPALQTLHLSKFYGHGSTCLMQLFDRYATLSQPLQMLRTVILDESNAVSDGTLASLGYIRTLREITLSDLKTVTPNGIRALLEKCARQLINMTISRIPLSNKNIELIAIHCIQLEHLALHYIQQFDDFNLKSLVNNLSTHKLKSMQVVGCEKVTWEGTKYASKKVRFTTYLYEW